MTNVAVHTMGRVGSQNMVRLLQLFGVGDRNIIHAHRLQEPTREYEQDYSSRTLILLDRIEKWKCVTLVREPVARNLSAWFLNYYGEGKGDLELRFQTEYPHMVPLDYFHVEIEPFWDVEIIDLPFDKERGWQIYDNRVLALRLENFNTGAMAALEAFLGMERPHIKRDDLLAEGIRPDYHRLRMGGWLPQEYLDIMYSSSYAQTFYTEAEIEHFKEKWRKD